MPQIVLKKAAFYPLDSRVVHPSGTVLEVTEDEAAVLRERGVVADEVVEEKPEPEPVEEPEPEPVEEPEATPTGGYPPLPKRTEPVARWKEYARTNGIKLTGLTRRNEIMGYIIKVVNAQ
ncbi:hypothetical protein HMPREF2806_09525 [Corynebacterium sp. HMSC076G08]|uniref:hypothetical protein n=1 Tax=unclassified Corynebacterium TaxID=2624378 RepID=UPI0008A38BE2|nr:MULTISPECIES: hypothetical protein [unclassified Corynebacterium]OFK66581.1 hypothetical protein HMPREF2806_09525 [Corynebacterium sp. HMSC076G08]OFN33617.1 hypothetical protein HMPREF2565_11815 [Corynebacterium sp. HMSC072A04]